MRGEKVDIQNVFGESFQRFFIEAAAFVDHLQSKETRTKQEDDFIKAFEEIADILISPEFQRLISKRNDRS
jgi:hypothetical protein